MKYFLQVFMEEDIVIYHISDTSTPVVMSRKLFYAERHTLYAEYLVSVVDIWIFDPRGRIILQKRAAHLKAGGGKFHTSVGGHMNPTETVSFTLLHECLEEF